LSHLPMPGKMVLNLCCPVFAILQFSFVLFLKISNYSLFELMGST
jgi:hypothetical protein